MVERSDELLASVEGHSFERLVAKIYEERSRKSLPGFNLSYQIKGYWNSGDTEIDFVAMDEQNKIIRLATCKRSSAKLVDDIVNFKGHVNRFLDQIPHYDSWTQQLYAIAPVLGES